VLTALATAKDNNKLILIVMSFSIAVYIRNI
jgi:hypothetical protein